MTDAESQRVGHRAIETRRHQRTGGGFAQSLAAQMIRENPAGNEDFAIHLQPPGLVNGQLRGAALGMGAALLLVGALTLLVACTNLSGLVLAHAADRRKEMAIRLAIGAGRGTIVRMLLTESMLIGIAGGICGLVVAAWSSSAIQVWAPMSGLPLPKYSADWRVFAFGIGAALLTTILAGLLPALRAGAVDVAPALKNESTAAVRGLHLRDVYLGVQVAVCICSLGRVAVALRRCWVWLRSDRSEHARDALRLRSGSCRDGARRSGNAAVQSRAMPGLRSCSDRTRSRDSWGR